ncbi:hypothetical protein [Inquilinus sp.]|jgi:hypothetical protein|uniref:hypothetical protein n=1 Tax=Inquilinus sp. TaxID=1932117 RepID=UPI003784E44B
MRSAVRSWLAQCGDDGPCLERRQFNMLRTLTKGIDGAGWGGRYAGPHWTLYVLPSQFVDEVNAVFVLDRGGRASSIRAHRPPGRHGRALAAAGSPGRKRARSGSAGAKRPGGAIDPDPIHPGRIEGLGPSHGADATLDSQCRAGAIYGEYRSQEPTAVKVSYLGAPGLEPIAPHIMVPGP